MEISYLYKERLSKRCNQETKLKTFTIDNEKLFVALNIGKDFIVLDPISKGEHDISTKSTYSPDTVKGGFRLRRRVKQERYSFVRFKADITEFCIDDAHNAYVFTVDGKISLLSIRKLADYLLNPIGENSVHGSMTDASKKKCQINFEDVMISNPIQIYNALQPSTLRVHITSTLQILLLEKGNLRIFDKQNSESNQISQIAFHQLHRDSEINNVDSTPQLFVLSCDESYNGKSSISPVLYDTMFDTNRHDMCFSLFTSLKNGSIFNIQNTSIGKTLKLIYDLKQELIYMTCLSISEVRNDVGTATIYDSIRKGDTEKALKIFKQKRANDTLLFVGLQGKLLLLFKQGSSNELSKTSYEYQLPLPIESCTTKKDFLIVSNSKVINIFKVFLVVKLKQDFIDGKEVVKRVFVPEHELVYTIPVPNITKMLVLEMDPFVICAVNYKMNVIRIDVTENLKGMKCKENLDNLMKKLEVTQSNLQEVRNCSKNVTVILKELKSAIALCHKISMLSPGAGAEMHLDVTYTYKNIQHNNACKLFVNGRVINNSNLTLTRDCFITIVYYQKYHSFPLMTNHKVGLKSECFMLPPLNPGGCFEFQFLIDSSFFMNYSELNIDSYFQTSFKNCFDNHIESNPRSYGVSLFLKSSKIDIIDKCELTDLVSTGRNDQRFSLKNHSTQKEYCCSLLVPVSRTNYVQKLCNIPMNKPFTPDFIAFILYKYLLKEDNIERLRYNPVLTYLGETLIELSVEVRNDMNNTFVLKYKTLSLNSLIAVHHYVFRKMEGSILQGREFKVLFDSKLLKLKELKVLHESIAILIDKADNKTLTTQELSRKLTNTYLLLRKIDL